jgi:hypothetical protein
MSTFDPFGREIPVGSPEIAAQPNRPPSINTQIQLLANDMSLFGASVRSYTPYALDADEIMKGQRRTDLGEGVYHLSQYRNETLGIGLQGLKGFVDPELLPEYQKRQGAGILGIGKRQDYTYNPFRKIEGTIFSLWPEAFDEVDSDPDLAYVQNFIMTQLAAKRRRDEAGLAGVLTDIAASILDPILLASIFVTPGGGFFRNLVKNGGKHQILKGAGFSALANSGAIAATELLLHHQQVTREPIEGIATVTAGTLLTGVMGGVFTHLAKRQQARIAKDAWDMLTIRPGDDVLEPGSIRMSVSEVYEDTGVLRYFSPDDPLFTGDVGQALPSRPKGRDPIIEWDMYPFVSSSDEQFRDMARRVDPTKLYEDMLDVGFFEAAEKAGRRRPSPFAALLERSRAVSGGGADVRPKSAARHAGPVKPKLFEGRGLPASVVREIDYDGNLKTGLLTVPQARVIEKSLSREWIPHIPDRLSEILEAGRKRDNAMAQRIYDSFSGTRQALRNANDGNDVVVLFREVSDLDDAAANHTFRYYTRDFIEGLTDLDQTKIVSERVPIDNVVAAHAGANRLGADYHTIFALNPASKGAHKLTLDSGRVAKGEPLSDVVDVGRVVLREEGELEKLGPRLSHRIDDTRPDGFERVATTEPAPVAHPLDKRIVSNHTYEKDGVRRIVATDRNLKRIPDTDLTYDEWRALSPDEVRMRKDKVLAHEEALDAAGPITVPAKHPIDELAGDKAKTITGVPKVLREAVDEIWDTIDETARALMLADNKVTLDGTLKVVKADNLASVEATESVVVHKGTQSLVDIVFDGNSDLSYRFYGQSLYDSFRPIREALREISGSDHIRLYRAQSPDGLIDNKHTLTWATKKEAEKYMEPGRVLVERNVPIDDVVALNMAAGKRGKGFHEFIVFNEKRGKAFAMPISDGFIPPPRSPLFSSGVVEYNPNWAAGVPEKIYNNKIAVEDWNLAGFRLEKAWGFEKIANIFPIHYMASSSSYVARRTAALLARSPAQWVDDLGRPVVNPISVDQKAGKRMESFMAEMRTVADKEINDYFRSKGRVLLGDNAVSERGIFTERIRNIAEAGRDIAEGRLTGPAFGGSRSPLIDPVTGKHHLDMTALDFDNIQLTSGDFLELVTWALDHGDELPGIPQVGNVAKKFRQILDEVGEDMVKTKLLPAEAFRGPVRGAMTYFARYYNTTAIRKNKTVFRDLLVKDWMLQDGTLTKTVAEREAFEAIEKIIGNPGRIAYDQETSVQKRLITTNNALMQDYLQRDPFTIMEHYLRSYVPDIEIMKAPFGIAAGSKTVNQALDKALDALSREMKVLIDAAPENRIPRALRKPGEVNKTKGQLQREYEINATHIRNLFSEVRHMRPSSEKWAFETGTAVTEGLVVLRNLTTLSKGGYFVISSIMDPGRIAQRNSIGEIYDFAIKGFMKNPIHFTKMSLQLQKDLKIGAEAFNGLRAQKLMDTGDEFGTVGGFAARTTRNMTSAFMYANLLTPWNAYWKGMTSAIVAGRVRRAVLNVADGITDIRAERFLKENGISPEMAQRMAEEIGRHGDRQADNWLVGVNAHKWNRENGLAESFADAVARETDITINTPGAGERPWAMLQNDYIKTMMIFRTFAMISIGQTIIPSVQRLGNRDIAVLNGMGIALFGGMMSHTLKETLRGRDPFEGQTTLGMIENSLDRSGILGGYGDIYNMLRKFDIIPGPGQGLSRFRAQNFWQQIMGAAMQTPFDAAVALGDVINGPEDDTGDILSNYNKKSVRRMMPFQNLFYIDWMTRQITEAREQSGGRSSVGDRTDQLLVLPEGDADPRLRGIL